MTENAATSPGHWQGNVFNGLAAGTHFRIMRISHLTKMLKDREIFLPATSHWDDPCEDMLRHAIKFTNKGFATFQNLTRGMCALCFSLPPECDAMWRLYGNRNITDAGSEDLTVRVEFRLGALLDMMWRRLGSANASLFLWTGKIEYLDEVSLRSRIHDLVDKTDGLPGNALLDPSNRRITQTLFMKRKAFAFEREVRILIDPRFPDARIDTKDNVIQGCRIPIDDPASFIDSVTACPWIIEKDEKVVRNRLVDAGWVGAFNRSSIYDHPIAIASSGPWLA